MDEALLSRIRELEVGCVFLGDIKPAENPTHLGGLGWRSLKGTEADKTGGCPSYERVQAAGALHRMNPRLKLIVSGGFTNVGDTKSPVTIAAVAAAELREMGVPAEAIIEESAAFTNWEQILFCSKIIRELGFPAEKVSILQLFFVFNRVTAMIANGKRSEVAPFAIGKTTLLSVERVLAAEDPTWNQYFKGLYATPKVMVTIMGDALGAGQLWTGHQPKYPNPFRGFEDPLK